MLKLLLTQTSKTNFKPFISHRAKANQHIIQKAQQKHHLLNHHQQRTIFSFFNKKQPRQQPKNWTKQEQQDYIKSQEDKDKETSNYQFVKDQKQNSQDNNQEIQNDNNSQNNRGNDQLEYYKQISVIKEEDTQILKELYEVKEHEGLERFENALSKIEEFEKRVSQSKDLTDLSILIGETNKKLQMKFKREHKYSLQKYEEQLYKEVIYDLRPDALTMEDKEEINTLKKARIPGILRNIDETAKKCLELAEWPMHQRRPYRIQNMHEPESTNQFDPYHWIKDMSSEERDSFASAEETYTNLCLLKNDILHKNIIREQQFYEHVEAILPVRIGDYIYYRRPNNTADLLTLYRYPADELQQVGFKEGEIPYEKFNEDQNNVRQNQFKEQIVFSLNDLVEFYQQFALIDERIKEFVEKITQIVQTSDGQPLHWFQIDNELQYCVLFFDTDGTQKSIDLIVKDLSINKLMPLLIYNTDGQVAFDKFNGFFYTQVDVNGRGAKIFRHQLGSLHSEDVLIYEEINPDFSVSVENTLSEEFIMIRINSTFQPSCNEIWIKNAKDDKEQFWLVQPIRYEVRYDIKHAGEFLYKISNEEDLINQKVTKIRLPNAIKYIPDNLERSALPEPKQSSQIVKAEDSSVQLYRLGKRETINSSKYLSQRQNPLLIINNEQNNESALIQVPQEVTTVIQSTFDEKILAFEVFKHYLALLQERNFQRELKVVNLKTNRHHTHLFDSEFELNPASGQVTDFFDIELEDNYTFDTAKLRYRLLTPNTPERVLHFNMGTKKVEQVYFEQYQNLNKPQNIECEKIMVKMRDDYEMPMVMTYDRTQYNESSPWIMFTNGAQSSKADISFDITKVSLMNRGMVCAYPLLRGTKYFDDNWYFSGVGERKFTHIMDLIDSAIYVKEKGLTKKIGVLGLNESGSLSVLTSVFQEPLLFDAATVYNPITDLINHLLYDVEQRQSSKGSVVEFENYKHQKIQEFGDIHNKLFYESLHMMSPYHMPHHTKQFTDLMVTVDQDFKYGYHARKLMCKLREIYRKDPSYIFYREFPEKMFTREEKLAYHYSFLINSLLFR